MFQLKKLPKTNLPALAIGLYRKAQNRTALLTTHFDHYASSRDGSGVVFGDVQFNDN